MKIRSALFITVILLLIPLLSFAIFANEEAIDWDESIETQVVDVSQGQWTTYRYTPSQTRQYAIKHINNTPLVIELSTASGDYVEHNNWMDEENNSYEIFDFIAGTEYIIKFGYSWDDDNYDGTYSDDVSIIPWEYSVTLPDYPYIQDNEKVTVTLKEGESSYYLYSATQTGTYCQGQGTSCVLIDIVPVQTAPNQDPHWPEPRGNWNTDNEMGNLFYLEAGNLYLIEVRQFTLPHGQNSITDTVWIRPGEAPKDEYPVWDMRKSTTVTLENDERAKFYLTPKESGKYMMLANSGIRVDILHKDSIYDDQFSTSDGTSGYIFDLKAGEEYVLCFEEWGVGQDSVSGTFKFEKVGPVKSASIYVANFASDFYILGTDFDPICGFLEGVTWSISDPSVFSIRSQSDTVLELEILKKGKATITAKVGNVTASIELTSDPKLPVLKEGQTLNMTIGGSAAEFTPAKSGKYEFTLIPNRMMTFSIISGIHQDTSYIKTDFIGKQVFTVNLNAGQKYEMVQLFGRASISVKYVGGSSSSQGSTTQPTEPADQPATSPAPTAASQAVTEPTQLTEPIATETTPTDITTMPDAPIGTMQITESDVADAIENAADNTISFKSERSEIHISADALQLAASGSYGLSLDFPQDVNVRLDNAVLQALSANTDAKSITVSVTPETFYDLNASQQDALEGKSLIWLLDVTLTVDGESIHQLGGSAQISFPSKDSNKDWSVLYLAEDGSIEVMEITSDENISFSTEHFSHYALVWAEKAAEAPANKWIIPAIIAAVVIAGGGTAAFFIIRKKKQ